MAFNEDLPVILKFEGGFVDDPDDSGGATNKGVTQETYNRFRKLWQTSLQHVRYITDDEVRRIYEAFYKDCKADTISRTHPITGLVHFDCGINSGSKQAAKILQRALAVEPVDGIIGSITLTALNLSSDSETARQYLKERESFYKSLVAKRPKDQKFLKGWLWRLAHLEKIINDRSTSGKQTN